MQGSTRHRLDSACPACVLDNHPRDPDDVEIREHRSGCALLRVYELARRRRVRGIADGCFDHEAA